MATIRPLMFTLQFARSPSSSTKYIIYYLQSPKWSIQKSLWAKLAYKRSDGDLSERKLAKAVKSSSWKSISGNYWPRVVFISRIALSRLSTSIRCQLDFKLSCVILSKDCLRWHHVEILFWVVISSVLESPQTVFTYLFHHAKL